MTASDTPSDADLLRLAARAALGSVRVAIPAVVVAYDRTKQTISAQVVIRSRYVDPDGEPVYYLPKPIANVPVQFPSGSGGALTFPLAEGDPVTLLVADRSIDEWKATGQQDNTPADVRRFDLTDAIALPGGRAPADPLASTATDASAVVLDGTLVKLGDATAASFVALATGVLAKLNAIEAAFNAHVHPVPGVTVGAGATVSSVVAAPVTPSVLADVAATKVKAK